jgi:hypothetical protein
MPKVTIASLAAQVFATSTTQLGGTPPTVPASPAKLSARARVFSTGQGRKTNATDAHPVAVARCAPVAAAGPRPVIHLRRPATLA